MKVRAYDGHLVSVEPKCPMCNGTHVLWSGPEFEMTAEPCPVCGPISQEESHRRIEAIRKEWAPYAPKEEVNA
ncbi:hypothetical protein [Lentilactobacillus senioris]|uniref:hypothetical protein n=1 Tax=Lentilactobacillus senioris TaxID=931534 RepID=UPI003D2A249C